VTTSTDDDFDSLLAAVARIPERDASGLTPPDLDEYKLIRPLGHGGMGSVWLAEDRLLDRLVAIKSIAHLEPTARERFLLEARAAARLQHANVVSVYRFGEHAGRPFIVAEYIRGESLDKLAKPMPWSRVLELGIALARGLAAAHRRGIIHRDIKPANAILAEDGEAKLVDFGLAKIGEGGVAVRPSQASFASGSSPLTSPGAIAGTPLYLAPEVRAGGPATRRSDVYQLGAVLYELVTGRAPLLDQRDGAQAPVAIHVEGAKLGAIIDRCLRRDPTERFASGDELREALERIAAPQLGGELPAGNPYRGLVAFEAQHRALFFGRGADIRAIIERLRSDTFVAVTGDSGVGKSSLCRAGVLPHIVDGALGDGLTWHVAMMVPGERPLTALASALAGAADLDEITLLAMLRDQPTAALRDLRRALGKGRGIVVFVDQLEELVTLAGEEADAFSDVLDLLAGGLPGLRLLATLRGDFVSRLDVDLSRALHVLRPLTDEGRREAVVGPARATGVRFESDALVDTLVFEHVELPLLEFTLAQLWDARDDQTISARSLEAIGGVRGALARHADSVISALVPERRGEAKRILLRLVTPDRTRARRSADELGASDDVLDALVRGRLVAARGDDPPLFELAHERLIDSWPMLAEWLSRTAVHRAMHARLEAAVANWERLDHASEALWRERQLADIAALPASELTAPEARFVTASRRAVRRRRGIRIAALIAVPLVIASFVVGARVLARRNVNHAIEARILDAQHQLDLARTASKEVVNRRDAAAAAFDTGRDAEAPWRSALDLEQQATTAYARASGALEAALLLDSDRRDIRRRLAEVTLERIRHADAMFKVGDRDELRTRLAIYDDDGSLMRALDAPARLVLDIEPRDALISIEDRTMPSHTTIDLAPRTYSVLARAPGRAPVRISVLLTSGETKALAFELPLQARVPAGFVYVPPGDFLYGSRDAEPIRRFYSAPPMHTRRTGGYLIGQTEVTYAQWIEFLDALSLKERARRAPHVEGSQTIQNVGGVDLTRDATGWSLAFEPVKDHLYKARAGEAITYPDRTHRMQQDWLRMPVAGITVDDAQAYAAWLDETHRVPHARLCREAEWERAARGADGRTYPHGDRLAPDDANIDVTYGQQEAAFGPDEVGAHPATTSPFGLADTAGNLWELVRAESGAILMRGGSFYTNAETAALANRSEALTPSFRHVLTGVRLCAGADL
jgi:formylglycine-generating enzyme required for sulfatase activity/predicted Ser/Thr protein kinase